MKSTILCIFCILLLNACNSKEPKKSGTASDSLAQGAQASTVDSTPPDTTAEPAAKADPSTTSYPRKALVDHIDSLTSQCRDLEPHNENSPVLKYEAVDEALNNYSRGDSLDGKILGNEECSGNEIVFQEFQHGLIQVGSTYSIYGLDWYFQGEYSSLLNLRKGMSPAEAKATLGEPYHDCQGLFHYRSDIVKDEEDYFPNRWDIYLLFQDDKLETIHFSPNINDC